MLWFIMSDLVRYIQQEAICFQDIETACFDQFFSRCQKARVVLLGESTHGSSEYYRMRARLTKELVAKGGFTLLAVEGDWPDLEEVDRYARGFPIRTTPFQRFPAWMWNNPDFLQFIDWAKAYNASQNAPLRIYGLDLYLMRKSLELVANEVGRDSFREILSLGIEPSNYFHYCKLTNRSYETAFQSLLDAAVQKEVKDEESFHFLQNLKFLVKGEAAIRLLDEEVLHWNIRARQMFDALLDLLEFHGPESKAIVWVHNTHVGHTKATPMEQAGRCNIGTLCKGHFGSLAYTVGFGCYEGEVVAASHWCSPHEIKKIPPALEGSYERLFFECRLGSFFLSLHEQAGALLKEKRLQRGIGTIYDGGEANYYPASLAEQFDAYIWFDSTTPVI